MFVTDPAITSRPCPRTSPQALITLPARETHVATVRHFTTDLL
jgi:hypothetical protein